MIYFNRFNTTNTAVISGADATVTLLVTLPVSMYQDRGEKHKMFLLKTKLNISTIPFMCQYLLLFQMILLSMAAFFSHACLMQRPQKNKESLGHT